MIMNIKIFFGIFVLCASKAYCDDLRSNDVRIAKTIDVETLSNRELKFLPNATCSEVVQYLATELKREWNIELILDVKAIDVERFCKIMQKSTFEREMKDRKESIFTNDLPLSHWVVLGWIKDLFAGRIEILQDRIVIECYVPKCGS